MLVNGDHISGDIISEQGNAVVIKNENLGEVTLNRAQIASLHKGMQPRVLARELRTGEDLSAPVAAPTAKTETQTAAATTETKSEERQDGVYKWTGRVGAGGTVQSGNSDSKTFFADADVKARDKLNRFGFGGEANWAEDEGEKTDNDQQIYANYDRFITEKWFIGGQQSLERDEFENLDYRSKTGAFLGHQFYEQDDLNFQIKAGPEYV